MATNDKRGANQIEDGEFLQAYNNPNLTNAAVLETLNTDWTAVGVKLRSERLQLHTTMKRTGAAKGVHMPKEQNELAPEAIVWLANGTIQPKPVRGSYEPMTAVPAGITATATVAAPTQPLTTNTSSAQTAATQEAAPAAAELKEEIPAAQEAPSASTQSTYYFEAEILGTTYRFEGPDKDAAHDALYKKLREANFSKVQVSDRTTGRPVGLNEMVSGGKYKFSKQLTAA